MKVFALVSLFVSFSAMAACPDLSGTFTMCHSSTGEMTDGSVISQKISNGVTTYTIISKDEESGAEIEETVIADGATRTSSATDDQTGMVLTMITKAACAGAALKYDAKVLFGADVFANVQMSITKTGSKLTTVTTGTTGSDTINETVICE